MFESFLVTGGAGFIGSHLVRHLASTYPAAKIIVIDALTYAGRWENLGEYANADNVVCIHGDIRDLTMLERVRAEHEPDAIVHLAAESHVDRSIHRPADFVTTNVVGTTNLLELGRQLAEHHTRFRFLHVSTDEVFGPIMTGNAEADTPYQPSSPYAASKAAADHFVRSFATTYNLPVVITNTCNNYGPNQHLEKLIPFMILRARRGETLPIYGDGEQVREWLHVRDHVRAIDCALHRGTIGATYLVGSGDRLTNKQLVIRVCSILDERCGGHHASQMQLTADRPGHDRRYALDSSRIHQELDWHAEIELDAGLRETVAWYLDNAEWMEAARTPDLNAWIATQYGHE